MLEMVKEEKKRRPPRTHEAVHSDEKRECLTLHEDAPDDKIDPGLGGMEERSTCVMRTPFGHSTPAPLAV
jgi:hypothetical protein